MPIAAFVDEMEQPDLAVELAIGLAEFSMDTKQELYLLTDLVTALEIGLALTGLRQSRTVEGGKYDPSPITLLPYLRRGDSEDEETALRDIAEDRAGTIDDFREIGVFRRSEEVLFDFGKEPEHVFRSVLREIRPRHVIGLGKRSPLWNAIESGLKDAPQYQPRLVMIEGFGRERAWETVDRKDIRRPERPTIVRSKDSHFERDEFETYRIKAEADGALVGALYDYLRREVT